MTEVATRFRKSQNVASRTVDGKAVVIVMGGETLHALNETGTFLWGELCEHDTADLERLAGCLAGAYAIEADSARRDTIAFLETLLEVGAIERVGA